MQKSEKKYTIIREEDYVQSANTLFHFMKEEQWLKDSLSKKALVPRFCVENIEYLEVNNNRIAFNEVAILQKCFCDVPFHKLMQNFSLHGEGEEFEKLDENDKFKASRNNTHPDFYGEYAIAFSKKWGEKHNLQPIHYLNIESSHTKELKNIIKKVISTDEINDIYADDILNRLSFIKPIRGIMNRQFITEENKEVTLRFCKNFHDEKEWRYVPNDEQLQKKGLERIIANPNITKDTNFLNMINKEICSDEWEEVWLKYTYDEIRYIIVPNSQARIDIINFILNLSEEKFNDKKQAELEKQIMISKILVLEEIRKDW